MKLFVVTLAIKLRMNFKQIFNWNSIYLQDIVWDTGPRLSRLTMHKARTDVVKVLEKFRGGFSEILWLFYGC